MPDVIIVDVPDPDAVRRRRNISIIVSIPARYILTRQLDVKGNRREFSCRVVKLSPHEMVLAAPVKGEIGERVIASLVEFGKFEGAIVKTHDLGFVMSLSMTDEERERLAARIEWYEGHKHHDLTDGRKFKRISPENPHSVVILSDGRVVGAFIIDASVSGAAVSADVDLEIGEPIAVGKVVGRVVRHFRGGFAVRFVNVQSPHMLEKSLLALPEAK
jgi:hypothetical protein